MPGSPTADPGVSFCNHVSQFLVIHVSSPSHPLPLSIDTYVERDEEIIEVIEIYRYRYLIL